MGLEGKDNTFTTFVFPDMYQFLKQFFMPTMNPVESTDGNDTSIDKVPVFYILNYFHFRAQERKNKASKVINIFFMKFKKNPTFAPKF